MTGQLVQFKSVSRTTILKVVSWAKEVAVSVRGLGRTSGEGISTVTFLAILNTEEGETNALSGALVESHRGCVVESRTSKGPCVLDFCVASLTSICTDSWLWS